jgi:DNA-directed RNA polymerase subunit E'/Rpb7
MDNIYFNCILTKKIVIESKYLNENIDDHIETYFKKKVEGICIDEGYVKPESIKILKKSVGMLLGSRFTGDISYEVAYTADICNPVIGNLMDCKVKFINKLGILGHNGPITIIIGKQFHNNDDEINNIKENDIIKVEVIDKKFSLNDKEIKIVAKLYNENEKINVKKNKKEFISSDLTPIIAENEFIDNENQDLVEYNSDENEEFSIDEEEEEELDDDFIESDEEEDNIKMENPDENNLDVDDIELEEDEEDDKDYDESSDIDYD